MKKLPPIAGLLGLAAFATLALQWYRNLQSKREQGAREVNRWENEGGKVLARRNSATSEAGNRS